MRKTPTLPPPFPISPTYHHHLIDTQTKMQINRGQILIRLQAAREMGDLSENGAYHAARHELSSTDRRLRDIAFQLRFGQVTVPDQFTRVAFGQKVTLEISGRSIDYVLVSRFESDPGRNLLSIDSPLGQAILGKPVGAEVQFTTPLGMQTVIIKAIINP